MNNLKNTIAVLSIFGFLLPVFGQEDNNFLIEDKGNSYNTLDTIRLKINKHISYPVFKVLDKDNLPILYYCNIRMMPCKGDKCEIINISIYWDANGNYFKFKIPVGGRLSKLNHKEFSDKEYVKLHKILLDSTSDFRFLSLNDLTEKQAESSFYDTDAVSGATIKKRDFECVNGAVKTSYQLWHIANGDISDFIRNICDTTLNNSKNNSEIDSENIMRFAKQSPYWFSKYLNNHVAEFKLHKNHIEKLAIALLDKAETNSLLLYNYLLRSEYNKPKKQIRFYTNHILIKNIKPFRQ